MAVGKDIFVCDIKDKDDVDSLFLVKTMRLSETKVGKPFLALELMDRTGEVIARGWDGADRLAAQCPTGSVVRVLGQAQVYKGSLQLKVTDVAKVDIKVIDWSRFLPTTPCDIGAMAEEILTLIADLPDHDIQRLLLAVVGDQPLWKSFQSAPAAKSMHHAYIGGLLEHSLGICRLAERVCGLYPSIDRSLLIAGTLFHDLGKVREFSFAVPPFDYSDQGRLLGHMVISLEILQEKLVALAPFPERTAMMIKHLIISHHGRYEFGSPALPMIREAFVLNFLDDLDSKMNYLDRLSRQAPAAEYQWTEYQRTMERFLFVTGPTSPLTTVDELGNGSDDELGERQASLWG